MVWSFVSNINILWYPYVIKCTLQSITESQSHRQNKDKLQCWPEMKQEKLFHMLSHRGNWQLQNFPVFSARVSLQRTQWTFCPRKHRNRKKKKKRKECILEAQFSNYRFTNLFSMGKNLVTDGSFWVTMWRSRGRLATLWERIWINNAFPPHLPPKSPSATQSCAPGPASPVMLHSKISHHDWGSTQVESRC